MSFLKKSKPQSAHTEQEIIPGCKLFSSTIFRPLPGFVDYYECIPLLRQWCAKLQEWESQFPNTKGHLLCVVNGFVKVGKSAVLDLIPEVVPSYFQDFHICQLSFESYSRKTALDFLSNLFTDIEYWARTELNLSIPPPIDKTSLSSVRKSIVYALMFISGNYNGKVFYLIDEVQRMFQLPKEELDASSMFAYFKELVGNYQRQYFVVTGSGMATAWNAFFKAPANGHRLANTIFQIDIPEKCDDLKILEWCVENTSDKDFGIPNLTNYFANPAQFVFMWLKINAAKKRPTNEQELNDLLQTEVDTKYLQEFVDDTIPLLSHSLADDRKYLCELVLGITQMQPYGYSDYLKPFIEQVPTAQNAKLWNAEHPTEALPNGSFVHLRSNQFSALVTMFFSADGTIIENVLAQFTGHKSLPISIYKWNMKNAVSYLGSLCEGINPTWKGKPFQDPNDEQVCKVVERICGQVFSKHNLQLDCNTYLTHSWFQLVFHHPASALNYNAIETNVLNNPNRKPIYSYWYCTLLKLSQNLLFHRSAVEPPLQDFIAVMPNLTHELLVQIMQAIPDVEFLRQYHRASQKTP